MSSLALVDVILSASSITFWTLIAARAEPIAFFTRPQAEATFRAPSSDWRWRLLKLSTWPEARPGGRSRPVKVGPRVHLVRQCVRGFQGAVCPRYCLKDSVQLRSHTVANGHLCSDTGHGSSPSFLAFPFRFLCFFLFLFDLKVNRSINKSPFPKGKGYKRTGKDFQPVQGVMCVDSFAVRVSVHTSTGD